MVSRVESQRVKDRFVFRSDGFQLAMWVMRRLEAVTTISTRISYFVERAAGADPYIAADAKPTTNTRQITHQRQEPEAALPRPHQNPSAVIRFRPSSVPSPEPAFQRAFGYSSP